MAVFYRSNMTIQDVTTPVQFENTQSTEKQTEKDRTATHRLDDGTPESSCSGARANSEHKGWDAQSTAPECTSCADER